MWKQSSHWIINLGHSFYPRSDIASKRLIHLLHHLYEPPSASHTNPLGKLAWKTLPDVSQSKICLINGQEIEKTLSIPEVQNLLNHGQYLEKLEGRSNADPAVIAHYRIAQLRGINHNKTSKGKRTTFPIYFKRAGRGKEQYLLSSSSPGSYHTVLQNSHKFINEGVRVEMHVSAGKDKLDLDTVFATNPHLRPEFMLKAMPKGASIIHGPLYEGKRDKRKGKDQLIWVMSNEGRWAETSGGADHSSTAQEHSINILKNLPTIG
ncbi:MAG: hypothetical protein Q9170_003665 [Blastenia crenularia]